MECSTCGTRDGIDCGWHNRPIRSRSDAVAAGRAHAHARGDRLNRDQIVRLAALLRPHLEAQR